MRPQYSKDSPDLMSAIVEETRRRNQDKWRRNSLPTNHSANDRTPHVAAPRNTFASHVIFAVLFSIILALSVIVGATLGLGVVALFFAFLLAPLSTPFFLVGALIGAAVLYLMLQGQRLASRAERLARSRREVRIARARHA
ncbi:MAG: hypothetical protein ABWZ40_08310 [Caulobacterales bacterium]